MSSNLPIPSPEELELESFLAGCIARCYAPRPDKNPWQYAEAEVYLDERMAAEPGFYNADLTTYAKRMQELGAAPAVDPLTGQFIHTYVCRKSSRSGITEAALNIIRWMPKNQPGHVLFGIDSKEEAKKISKERLLPTITALLGPEGLPKDPDDMGTSTMYLTNMTITMSGSYSEGVFANKWLRKGFLDECEVISQEVGGQHPIDLLKSRGTTVDDFQCFFMSKPKLPGTRFDKEYESGTQEKWFVPCPHCGHRQELIWDRVRFEHCRRPDQSWDKKRVLAETFYRCAGKDKTGKPLDCRITMDEQREMVRRGEWRVMNKDHEPGVVSQHISDLYSPFEKVNWGNLALIWLRSQNSITKIQHFWNNHMGLPFERHAIAVTEKDLLACRGGLVDESGDVIGPRYDCGQLPWIPTRLVAFSDVQDAEVKWEVWAIKGADNIEDIETALIDYGRSLDYDDLAALLERPYYVRDDESGTPYFASEGLCDSGHDTYKVYRFCIEDGRWYAAKGVGGKAVGDIVAIKEREFEGSLFDRYDYADHAIKVEFYEGRIKKHRGPRVWFFTDLGEEKHENLRLELMSEKLVAPRKDAEPKWKKTSGVPNDWGDAAKYIVVYLNVAGEYIIADWQAAQDEAARN